ncbi:hypothetical protein P344_00730 [Spiroplasma mirum ATCC 29335]|uniref:Serine aminopeptidase S33 domain-containing protein n=1 Tax=Spiroplasma mirum ATCC 29335 TaxID=838561 RepID=W0GPY5_9MOLU|nr:MULTISPECIES: alpha/beta hydrolase [Spiroplasma]AHF60586.1 putative transmembrane protein [Spiroplasma mirum ATCC 29335]AHI57519.1 hypothetical protein P344_00730 [Spiroplasma mirum ATCC 29335]AKM52705.1 hypothetical protein SATRI_v1c01260 [Spiroplasma atrichopogonis]
MSQLITIKMTIGIVFGILGFALLCYFISRFYKLFSKRVRVNEVQLPELIDNKYFISADQYQFSVLGEINKNDWEIILGIHDIYGNKNDFASLVNNKNLNSEISFLSFNQRNIGDNDYYQTKNIGILINDVLMAIEVIKNKYENQTITLLLEGYSCGLVNYLLRKTKHITKIILVNPITNKKTMRFSFFSKISIFFSFLFYLNKTLNINIDYHYFTNNQEYIVKMKANPQQYFLNQILQVKQINKRIIKKINNLQVKTLLLQSNGNKFYFPKRLAKITNPYVEITNLDNDNHFIFIDNLDEKIINSMNDFVQN